MVCSLPGGSSAATRNLTLLEMGSLNLRPDQLRFMLARLDDGAPSAGPDDQLLANELAELLRRQLEFANAVDRTFSGDLTPVQSPKSVHMEVLIEAGENVQGEKIVDRGVPEVAEVRSKTRAWLALA